MHFRRIVICGGAGFVGASLALAFKAAFPAVSVLAFDSLKRRGSELKVPRLQKHGVNFLQGDLRCREDVDQWPAFDLVVDCAAEASVQGGMTGAGLPVITNNLGGTVNCLEAARRNQAAILFLSTSRVYPIERLNALAFREESTRFLWSGSDTVVGCSKAGIAEDFPLEGRRSLYGATKLASELLVQEYGWIYQIPTLIDRCAVLAGPWQMGKVDQGLLALWVARHVFRRDLTYFGYGGSGKQVRDFLHIEDFCDLVCRQIQRPSAWDGRVYNVGGGPDRSASLLELTDHCRMLTGTTVQVHGRPEESPADIRIFLTDTRRVSADFDWRPRRSVRDVVSDTVNWIQTYETDLRDFLA
jgi:CDP-paratose 2-epimerase